jgi:hypothetical protein
VVEVAEVGYQALFKMRSINSRGFLRRKIQHRNILKKAFGLHPQRDQFLN